MNVCARRARPPCFPAGVRGKETTMIRQAISCDICGAEKRQTNHWFVACAHAGELRISGLNANGRVRAGVKHLCGQTCLHKLLDEFIGGTMSSRPVATVDDLQREDPAALNDTSLAAPAIDANYALPMAPIAVPNAPPPRSLQVVPAAVIIAPPRTVEESPAPQPPFPDPPNYASRRWRAEAWERERERERCASLSSHRKTS